LKYFENIGSSLNTNIQEAEFYNPFSIIDVNDFVSTIGNISDLGGGGDDELVVRVENGNLLVFDYNGNSSNPSFVYSSSKTNSLQFDERKFNQAPFLVDIDGDNDTDLVSGQEDGESTFFQNNGNYTHTSFLQVVGSENYFDEIDIGNFNKPHFMDIDSDSDFDIIIGREEGVLVLFENVGNSTHPSFSKIRGSSNPLNGIDVGDHGTPFLNDIDNDGDLDLIVADSERSFNFFENLGGPFRADFSQISGNSNPLSEIDIGSFVSPFLVDWDGDGDDDLYVGTADGGFIFFENGDDQDEDGIERCLSVWSGFCNNNGGCVDDVNFPKCTCFTGFTGDQSVYCLDGFYGSNCNLCPGRGTKFSITITDICSQQGTCDDGYFSSGNCSCNSPFYGDDCGEGECGVGFEKVLSSETLLYECETCEAGLYLPINESSCEKCVAGQ